jgi:hypothetical protein
VTILVSSSKFTQSNLTQSSHTSNVTSSELRIIYLPLVLHLSSIFFPLTQSIPTSDPKYFYSYPSQFSKVNRRVPSSKKSAWHPARNSRMTSTPPQHPLHSSPKPKRQKSRKSRAKRQRLLSLRRRRLKEKSKKPLRRLRSRSRRRRVMLERRMVARRK